VAAVASCQRCGDYACSSCLVEGVCTRCDERLHVLPWQQRNAIGFLPALFGTLKLSIIDPRRFARASAQAATPGDALLFALFCSAVNVLLFFALLSPIVWLTIRAGAAQGNTPMPPWWSIALAFAIGALGSLVAFAAGSYAWALVLRITTAAGSLPTRIVRLWCIVLYASGPLVAAWVPLAGFLAPAYGVVLTIMGVHEATGSKSMLRSALAVLVPLALFLVFGAGSYAAPMYFALQRATAVGG
jgi:hypothetical protein